MPDHGGTIALSPVRGLILMENHKGQAFDQSDLKKWLLLNSQLFKAEKVDIYAPHPDAAALEALTSYASTLGLRISLRVEASSAPLELSSWQAPALMDLCIQGHAEDEKAFMRWVEACESAKLPYRLQFSNALPEAGPSEQLKDAIQGATLVSLCAFDPFMKTPGRGDASTIQRLNDWTRACAALNPETQLIGLPFCHVDEDLLPYAMNNPQFYRDHQQYRQSAYDFASRMQSLKAHGLNKVLEAYLTKQTSFHNMIDDRVLDWVLNTKKTYFRLWFLHKITRHLNWLRHRPNPLPEQQDTAEAMAARQQVERQKSLGPTCSTCAYQFCCDYASEAFQQHFPGIQIQAKAGEPIQDPLHFRHDVERHFDTIDTERIRHSEIQEHLAEHVRQLTADQSPTREIPVEDYDGQDVAVQHMPGAVRWHSFANAELQSTPLAKLEPPFTLALTIGGGFAAQVGFSFGSHARVVCPMIAPKHKIMLHVAEDGHYVLLRDSELVNPTEFEDTHYVPRKLGSRLEPRIALFNINGAVLTQTLLLWEEQQALAQDHKPKYSAIIISTRYSRRLQAVLLGLAHQQNIDLKDLEIVIGYVPGIDGTDDLIDSMRHTFPDLRIIRSPFGPNSSHAKGYMINHSAELASGDWFLLLDSDIVLPPDFIHRMEPLTETAHYIAPDGRQMLTPQETGAVLLGHREPWNEYDALVEGEGEYRHHESDGVPPGFCQCVRRDVFEKIRYVEMGHFEGADWLFSKSILDEYGKETRLEGMRVLHLDHGGSQWYGTEKHM